jgi:cytidylate kinase
MTPVITIDGPSGAGKGTVSALLASKLGYLLLDSGAIYRVMAVASQWHNISADDEPGLSPLAAALDVSFEVKDGRNAIILEGEDVTQQIRSEEIGILASKIAALPAVREALLMRQRAFAENPGLVADGRDMGTVVFPHAQAKIFLTASAEERAQRRFNQLKEKGVDVTIVEILSDIEARDERDMNRTAAPLVAADGALEIDSTALSIDQVVATVVEFVKNKFN